MTPSELARFEAKYVPEPNSGCWLWDAAVDGHGYGQMGVRVNGRSRNRMAHRLSYEHYVGPIPAGFDLCHRCDVPACCNPAHLFPGTRKQNVDDCRAKDRHARGSRNGHALLTEASVREMRAMRAAGAKLADVADSFGVKLPTASQAINGITWAHVPGALGAAPGNDNAERENGAM